MARLKVKRAPASPRRKGGAIPWGLLTMAAFIVGGGVGFLLYAAFTGDARQSVGNREAEAFQAVYWKKPIALQGSPAEETAPPARRLDPEGCGLCHLDVYNDWRESLHSKAMGPGLLGQFPGMSFAGQAECLTCHAPMSEQWAQLPDGQGGWQKNAGFQEDLYGRGLMCSTCHLRGHRRHAPPPSPERLARLGVQAAEAVHGPAVTTPLFRASEFCKGCHQHATTTVMINGKTVENTYQEWLDSPQGAAGVSCQDCHMPQGRHLWRGIHDAGMTRQGVQVAYQVPEEPPRAGQALRASLTLTNTGTGHAFPTYTTPAVYLKIALLDGAGQVVPGGHYREFLIQRRLDMSTSPWSEAFDTRLFPGQSATVTLETEVPPEARELYLWVWVEPDQFYTGFYQARLGGGAAFPGRDLLESALADSLASQYVLFSRRVKIPATP